jgi:exodeoxyribonuclease V beta subunit
VRPVVENRVENANERQMREDLARLASAAAGAIEIVDLSAAAGPPYRSDASSETELRARVATRALSSLWRTGSFSSLIAAGAAGGAAADLGVDRDQDSEDPAAAPAAALAAALPLADFPGGTRSGLLLHQLFEDIDFPSADAAALGAAAARLVDAYGLEARWAEPIRDAIGEVLDTPLDDATTPLRLRDVGAARRLAELEFVLPVAHGIDRGASFTSGRLADALARRGGDLFRPTYLDSVRRLGFAPLSGFLRGYIDLVFEHGGRWYVVDYKSNLLGPGAADYGSVGMARAMEHHHYFLQYHLYVVAVHRYLALRVPGYDYDRHFGAALYLFVRGMSPRHPPGCGVFRDRPPRRLVEELSALLDGDARAGGGAPRQLSLPLGEGTRR